MQDEYQHSFSGYSNTNMGTKVSSGRNKNGARPWARRRTQLTQDMTTTAARRRFKARSTNLMMLRPERAARAQRSSTGAERSPFQVPLLSRWPTTQRAGADPEKTLGGADGADRAGYWSSRGSRDVRGRKHAPATGKRRTFMVSGEMRRREEKREERVSTWVTLEAVGELAWSR